MKVLKTNLLIGGYSVAFLALLSLQFLGVRMGCCELMHPILATVVAFLWMATLGRYRMRYGFISGYAGVFFAMGFWKAALWFLLPHLLLLPVTYGIACYASSFVLGARKGLNPDFDFHRLTVVIARFNPGSVQDACELEGRIRID